MPTVALRGLRKLELTQQQVARIDNFRSHCKQHRSSRLDCLFLRKFQVFVRNENLELSGISVRNIQSSTSSRSVYEKLSSICNLLLASHQFFVAESRFVTVFFETQNPTSDRSRTSLPWSVIVAKGFMSSLKPAILRICSFYSVKCNWKFGLSLLNSRIRLAIKAKSHSLSLVLKSQVIVSKAVI